MPSISYKLLIVLIVPLIGVFLTDQAIKEFFVLKAVEMYGVPQEFFYSHSVDLYETACVNMRLVFNYGVAFFKFLFF
jgi:hypothetical protein